MSMLGTVPNLVVAQRVIDKMTVAASEYLEDETGEAMIGLLLPGAASGGVPTIYVLDTIAPDASAERERYMFEQGDERQYEIFTWLYENWENQREKRRGSYGKAHAAKWDAPLLHLGDWHKQPGFMTKPSGGDLMSALDQLADPETNLEFLLAPIVTLGHPPTTGDGADVNYVTVPLDDGTNMQVDFWYINLDVGLFQPIRPVVYPDDQLPGLSQYPWHLRDEERAELEFTRLHQNNMFYSILLWDTDGKLPLDVCITTARMGASKIFLIVTPWDYPEKAPQIRLAPFVSMGEDESIHDVFAQWWAQSEPAPKISGWRWSEDKYLIDYIQAIEDELGLRPPEPEPEDEEIESDFETDDDDAVDEDEKVTELEEDES